MDAFHHHDACLQKDVVHGCSGILITLDGKIINSNKLDPSPDQITGPLFSEMHVVVMKGRVQEPRTVVRFQQNPDMISHFRFLQVLSVH
jgi:hypothetical protein